MSAAADSQALQELIAELKAYPDGSDLLLTALYTAAFHYRRSTSGLSAGSADLRGRHAAKGGGGNDGLNHKHGLGVSWRELRLQHRFPTWCAAKTSV